MRPQERARAGEPDWGAGPWRLVNEGLTWYTPLRSCGALAPAGMRTPSDRALVGRFPDGILWSGAVEPAVRGRSGSAVLAWTFPELAIGLCP